MSQDAALATGTTLDLTAGQPLDRVVDRVTLANQDSGCISVDLLGGLRVRAGGTSMGARELGGTKPRRVLLALLLHRGSPVSKDRLVSLLWGGSAPSWAVLRDRVCRSCMPGCSVRRMRTMRS
jgi:hypothetical protein